MTAPPGTSSKQKLEKLEDCETKIIKCLESAGKVLTELGKDKMSQKQVNENSSDFTACLDEIERELGSQIDFLAQIGFGSVHEGSSYPASLDLECARMRLDYVRAVVAKQVEIMKEGVESRKASNLARGGGLQVPYNMATPQPHTKDELGANTPAPPSVPPGSVPPPSVDPNPRTPRGGPASVQGPMSVHGPGSVQGPGSVHAPGSVPPMSYGPRTPMSVPPAAPRTPMSVQGPASVQGPGSVQPQNEN